MNDELSVNFKIIWYKKYRGSLNIVFGNNYVNTFLTNENKDLFNVVKKYLHPTNFKLIDWKKTKNSKVKKPIIKNKIVEDFTLAESAKTLDCFDLKNNNKFQLRFMELKFVFKIVRKKILIVSA